MIAADGVVHDSEGRYLSKDGSTTLMVHENTSGTECVPNAYQPAQFQTKYVKGSMMLLHLPGFADRSTQLQPSGNQGHWQYQGFFKGKRRVWDMHVQLEFLPEFFNRSQSSDHKEPFSYGGPRRIWIGAVKKHSAIDISGYVMHTMLRFCESLLKKMSPCVSITFGKKEKEKDKKGKVIQKEAQGEKDHDILEAHIVYPFHHLPNKICITPKSVLSQPSNKDFTIMDSQKRLPRMGTNDLHDMPGINKPNLEIKPNNIYTLQFTSMYADFFEWNTCNVPGLPNIPLTRFSGQNSGLFLQCYELHGPDAHNLTPNDHKQQYKNTLFEFAFTPTPIDDAPPLPRGQYTAYTPENMRQQLHQAQSSFTDANLNQTDIGRSPGPGGMAIQNQIGLTPIAEQQLSIKSDNHNHSHSQGIIQETTQTTVTAAPPTSSIASLGRQLSRLSTGLGRRGSKEDSSNNISKSTNSNTITANSNQQLSSSSAMGNQNQIQIQNQDGSTLLSKQLEIAGPGTHSTVQQHNLNSPGVSMHTTIQGLGSPSGTLTQLTAVESAWSIDLDGSGSKDSNYGNPQNLNQITASINTVTDIPVTAMSTAQGSGNSIMTNSIQSSVPNNLSGDNMVDAASSSAVGTSKTSKERSSKKLRFARAGAGGTQIDPNAKKNKDKNNNSMSNNELSDTQTESKSSSKGTRSKFSKKFKKSKSGASTGSQKGGNTNSSPNSAANSTDNINDTESIDEESDSQADPTELLSESDEDVLDYVSAHSCGDLSESSSESEANFSDDERAEVTQESLKHTRWWIDLRYPWSAPHLYSLENGFQQYYASSMQSGQSAGGGGVYDTDSPNNNISMVQRRSWSPVSKDRVRDGISQARRVSNTNQNIFGTGLAAANQIPNSNSQDILTDDILNSTNNNQAQTAGSASGGPINTTQTNSAATNVLKGVVQSAISAVPTLPSKQESQANIQTGNNNNNNHQQQQYSSILSQPIDVQIHGIESDRERSDNEKENSPKQQQQNLSPLDRAHGSDDGNNNTISKLQLLIKPVVFDYRQNFTVCSPWYILSVDLQGPANSATNNGLPGPGPHAGGPQRRQRGTVGVWFIFEIQSGYNRWYRAKRAEELIDLIRYLGEAQLPRQFGKMWRPPKSLSRRYTYPSLPLEFIRREGHKTLMSMLKNPSFLLQDVGTTFLGLRDDDVNEVSPSNTRQSADNNNAGGRDDDAKSGRTENSKNLNLMLRNSRYQGGGRNLFLREHAGHAVAFNKVYKAFKLRNTTTSTGTQLNYHSYGGLISGGATPSSVVTTNQAVNTGQQSPTTIGHATHGIGQQHDNSHHAAGSTSDTEQNGPTGVGPTNVLGSSAQTVTVGATGQTSGSYDRNQSLNQQHGQHYTNTNNNLNLASTLSSYPSSLASHSGYGTSLQSGSDTRHGLVGSVVYEGRIAEELMVVKTLRGRDAIIKVFSPLIEKPRLAIPLTNVIDVGLPDRTWTSTPFCGTFFLFQITTNLQRNYTFACSDENQRDDWISYLSQGIMIGSQQNEANRTRGQAIVAAITRNSATVHLGDESLALRWNKISGKNVRVVLNDSRVITSPGDLQFTSMVSDVGGLNNNITRNQTAAGLGASGANSGGPGGHTVGPGFKNKEFQNQVESPVQLAPSASGSRLHPLNLSKLEDQSRLLMTRGLNDALAIQQKITVRDSGINSDSLISVSDDNHIIDDINNQNFPVGSQQSLSRSISPDEIDVNIMTEVPPVYQQNLNQNHINDLNQNQRDSSNSHISSPYSGGDDLGEVPNIQAAAANYASKAQLAQVAHLSQNFNNTNSKQHLNLSTAVPGPGGAITSPRYQNPNFSINSPRVLGATKSPNSSPIMQAQQQINDRIASRNISRGGNSSQSNNQNQNLNLAANFDFATAMQYENSWSQETQLASNLIQWYTLAVKNPVMLSAYLLDAALTLSRIPRTTKTHPKSSSEGSRRSSKHTANLNQNSDKSLTIPVLPIDSSDKKLIQNLDQKLNQIQNLNDDTNQIQQQSSQSQMDLISESKNLEGFKDAQDENTFLASATMAASQTQLQNPIQVTSKTNNSMNNESQQLQTSELLTYHQAHSSARSLNAPPGGSVVTRGATVTGSKENHHDGDQQIQSQFSGDMSLDESFLPIITSTEELTIATGMLKVVSFTDTNDKWTESEKIAFWMNTYHCLFLHGILILGRPGDRDARSLFAYINRTCYIVGTHVFSLREIDNNILGFDRKGRTLFSKTVPQKIRIKQVFLESIKDCGFLSQVAYHDVASNYHALEIVSKKKSHGGPMSEISVTNMIRRGSDADEDDDETTSPGPTSSPQKGPGQQQQYSSVNNQQHLQSASVFQIQISGGPDKSGSQLQLRSVAEALSTRTNQVRKKINTIPHASSATVTANLRNIPAALQSSSQWVDPLYLQVGVKRPDIRVKFSICSGNASALDRIAIFGWTRYIKKLNQSLMNSNQDSNNLNKTNHVVTGKSQGALSNTNTTNLDHDGAISSDAKATLQPNAKVIGQTSNLAVNQTATTTAATTGTAAADHRTESNNLEINSSSAGAAAEPVIQSSDSKGIGSSESITDHMNDQTLAQLKDDSASHIGVGESLDREDSHQYPDDVEVLLEQLSNRFLTKFIGEYTPTSCGALYYLATQMVRVARRVGYLISRVVLPVCNNKLNISRESRTFSLVLPACCRHYLRARSDLGRRDTPLRRDRLLGLCDYMPEDEAEQISIGMPQYGASKTLQTIVNQPLRYAVKNNFRIHIRYSRVTWRIVPELKRYEP